MNVSLDVADWCNFHRVTFEQMANIWDLIFILKILK